MRPRRVSRAIELLTIMQSRRAATVEYLAQSLGCSRRTIFRDLNLLRDAGFAVQFDESHGTYIAHGMVATRPELSETEWVAVLLAAGLSPIADMDVYAHDLSIALAKLTTIAPPSAREKTNNLWRILGSAFAEQRGASTVAPLLGQILEAASQRRCLRIVFDGPSLESYNTKISPLKVFASREGWIMRAQSSWHKAVIDIPVAHIRKAEILNETYCPPRTYLRPHKTRTSPRAGNRGVGSPPITVRAPRKQHGNGYAAQMQRG